MSSQCTNDGTYTLTVTFELGIDLNMAQVLVQNRVSLAEPMLPELVKRRGVTVKKKSPSMLMIVNLFSPDDSRDNLYLSNYATIQLTDELARLAGRRRHHLPRPARLQHAGLARPGEDGVAQPDGQRRGHGHRAAERPGRRRADRPAAGPHGPGLPVHDEHAGPAHRRRAVRRHRSSRPTPTAGIVRLRDVARIELGAQAYDQTCTLDGKPSVALSIYQLPGSNALETAQTGHATRWRS